MTKRLTEQAAHLQKAVTSLVKKYQFRDRNDICAYGISVSQYYTLQVLGDHGALTMQELADQLCLAISTVTRVVDQLVKKRSVERHNPIRDRRICQVRLTEEGSTLLHTIQSELIAHQQVILQRIPAGSRDHVIWAIEQLAYAVDTWRKNLPRE